MSFLDIQSNILSGQQKMSTLVEAYLDAIEKTSDYNVFLEVYPTEALNKAKALDERLKKGQKTGKLTGMIVSVKDVLCQKGKRVEAASAMLKDFKSLFTATAIQRLLDEDAIIIGRVNCDEFAMGSSNENSVYGPVKNPIAPNLVPGGSSGASAASVNLDTCTISIGSDTGGSVRQPAAFCGVKGFKPSYGRISRHGLIAYASSFDQIGILGKDDTAIKLALEVMEGSDEWDATCTDFEKFLYKQEAALKLAWMPNLVHHPGMDPAIKEETLAAIQKIKAAGYQVEEVEFPYIDFVIPTYYILTTGEASTNLSRYDGIRYGHHVANPSELDTLYKQNRSEGFGKEVKRRIMLGTFVLSAGQYDAFFGKAQRVRGLLKNKMETIFEEYQVVIGPVSPVRPWRIGEKLADPVAVYLSDIYTVLANLCGMPAMSIPLNIADSPFASLQLMGPRGSDFDLLALSEELSSVV
jgi:aspartyl-tRNA(Asn)/glutamyl-tRNA(Gln) amidotransferase subunit A